MPMKTGFWIRITNGQVSDVWDYKPSDDKIKNELGWREAVEIYPDLIPNREIITTHHFNIDVTPAQIIWNKRQLDIDERKEKLLSKAKLDFKSVVSAEIDKQTDQYPETQYDSNVVNAAKLIFEDKVTAINLAVSHENLDILEL